MDNKIVFDDKKNKLGSGMGLYVVSNTIKKLKGHFTINSMQDGHKMTSFEVRLPYREPGISNSEGNETKQTELLNSLERQLNIHRFRQKLIHCSSENSELKD
jgi:hypothetical protein